MSIENNIKQWFSDHRIAFTERGEHSLTYMLSKPETTSLSVTITAITATTHQALIVHGGDVQPVVFQYGPHDFDERIHWLYSRECDHYVLEKASIGMGGQEHLLSWDREKAKEDLQDYMDDDMDPKYIGTVRYVLNDLDGGQGGKKSLSYCTTAVGSTQRVWAASAWSTLIVFYMPTQPFVG